MTNTNMGEITKLAKATSESNSLRTTVPSGVVKQLNLTENDSLEWNLKAEGSQFLITIKPLKRKV